MLVLPLALGTAGVALGFVGVQGWAEFAYFVVVVLVLGVLAVPVIARGLGWGR
jgi:hypothetical protein